MEQAYVVICVVLALWCAITLVHRFLNHRVYLATILAVSITSFSSMFTLHNQWGIMLVCGPSCAYLLKVLDLFRNKGWGQRPIVEGQPNG